MRKLLITISAVTLVSAILFSACASNNKNQENEVGETNQIEDVLSQLESVGAENAQQEIGDYVTPNESDFLWSDVEDGVALDRYTGTEEAICVPSNLGGKPVVEIKAGVLQMSKVRGLKLPDSVIRINDKAFAFVTTLVEIEFGSGVKEIGREALQGCSALVTVNLNDGLETIGANVFGLCTSLKQVQLPDTLKIIDMGAFVLSGIENIVIPGSVEKIGEQAFSCCEQIKTVVVEEGVSAIEWRAFEGCVALTSATIPSTVKELGQGIFHDTPNVTVTVKAGSYAEDYVKENGLSFQNG